MIAQLLERPVNFHPAIARLCGNVAAGLMLSQAIYWSTTSHVQKREGWFYKNWKEWQEETCLGRREQDAARGILREKGFIATETRKVDGAPTLHYRVNWSAIVAALENAPPRAIECTDTCNPMHQTVQSINAPNGAIQCTESCKPIKEAETSSEISRELGKGPHSPEQDAKALPAIALAQKVAAEVCLSGAGIIQTIAGAIEFCIKHETITADGAVEFLIAESRAEIKRGGVVDRFWFESRKWRKNSRAAPVDEHGGHFEGSVYVTKDGVRMPGYTPPPKPKAKGAGA